MDKLTIDTSAIPLPSLISSKSPEGSNVVASSASLKAIIVAASIFVLFNAAAYYLDYVFTANVLFTTTASSYIAANIAYAYFTGKESRALLSTTKTAISITPVSAITSKTETTTSEKDISDTTPISIIPVSKTTSGIETEKKDISPTETSKTAILEEKTVLKTEHETKVVDLKELLKHKRFDDIEKYVNSIASITDRQEAFKSLFKGKTEIPLKELEEAISNPLKVEKPLTLSLLLKLTHLLHKNKMSDVVHVITHDLSANVSIESLRIPMTLAFARKISNEDIDNFRRLSDVIPKDKELWVQKTLETIFALFKSNVWTKCIVPKGESMIGSPFLVKGFISGTKAFETLKERQSVIRFSTSNPGKLSYSRWYMGIQYNTLIEISADGKATIFYSKKDIYSGDNLSTAIDEWEKIGITVIPFIYNGAKVLDALSSAL